MPTIDYSNTKFYESLGFKVGVEIHQQLLTDKKMFCNCPAGKYTKIHDAEVLRHMRPTLSELGEYDGCALMEFKTKKEVIYLLNRESVCTYEMDDTPPFLVNQEGLDIAIEIALMLNCSIVDEIHISRKQYLDGSIPTGFQRTAVIGINGWIPYKGRKIRISHICYEEDACREVNDIGHTITFRTDRLGMPLIEIITCADIKTPQEAKEVVTELGRLMRATGKVRRGIGSVRQDVNASIAGGSRVEIKGVPQVGWIPALVHNEALRQKALLEIKQLLARKNITETNLKVLTKNLTKILSATKSETLRNNLTKGNVIGGIKINGIRGILNRQTQPTKTFADEIGGRLRVVACLDIMPNFFHTDNYPNYEGSDNDLALIKKELKISNDDIGFIVWGSKQDVTTALEEVRLRIVEVIKGIPNETRQPSRNGITNFERILPGPDRMYPDTDSPPTKITTGRVEKIKQQLTEVPWKREKRYVKEGIPYFIARELAISDKAPIMDKILANKQIKPTLSAVILTQQLKALRRKGIDVKRISEQSLLELFELYAKGMFYKEAIPLILGKLAQDNTSNIKDIIANNNLSVISESKLEAIIEQTIKDNHFKTPKSTKDNQLNRMIDFYAGKVMLQLKGRINGQVLRESIRKRLEKTL